MLMKDLSTRACHVYITTDLPDGLYRVQTLYLCAGFIVKNKHIVKCAPILRKRIKHFQTIAVCIMDGGNTEAYFHLI